LLKARGVAVLLVTHDPDEALRMADRIAVMRAGRLEQIGSPHEVYQRPLNAFVGEALGEINEFAAVIADGCAETPLGPIAAEGMAEGARARVLVRPESIVLARDECAGAASLRVVGSRLVGAITQVDLCSSREPADVVRVAHLDGLAPTPGERVWARLRAPNLAVIVSD
jgi:iron(III) transport system ATP-binding protein